LPGQGFAEGQRTRRRYAGPVERACDETLLGAVREDVSVSVVRCLVVHDGDRSRPVRPDWPFPADQVVHRLRNVPVDVAQELSEPLGIEH
jgi:hypothetical protein